MTVRERFSQNFVLAKDDVKSRLLSRSLLWMGLGVAVITLVAFLSLKIETFHNVITSFALNNGFWFSLIINMALIMGIFFVLRNPNISIIVPALMYAGFAFYQGFFVAITLDWNGITNFTDFLLVMLVPGGIFVLVGLVSYLNFFDFTKLIPFATISLFILMIMSFILFFIGGTNQRWFLILAAIVFIVWIGIDIQMIKNAEEHLSSFNQVQDGKGLNRLAFIFGLRLFIDFLNLLLIMIRLIGNR